MSFNDPIPCVVSMDTAAYYHQMDAEDAMQEMVEDRLNDMADDVIYYGECGDHYLSEILERYTDEGEGDLCVLIQVLSAPIFAKDKCEAEMVRDEFIKKAVEWYFFEYAHDELSTNIERLIIEEAEEARYDI